MKFKKGDKVKIIHKFKDIISNKMYYQKETVVNGYDKFTGYYSLGIDTGIYAWEEHWLEPVEEIKHRDGILGEVSYAAQTQSYDMVNKPKHYMLFPDKGIEVIDVVDVLMEKAAKTLNPQQLGYYTHLLGYLFRFSEKNGSEDLKKAKFYLDRIIEKK
jgi:hypothetical protein